MERDNLLGRVRERLSSCFFPKKFVAASMRGAVVGSVFPLISAEVVLFHLVQASIKYGDMPWYMADVVIMTVGFVEALTSPLFSWLGYKRRRTVMLAAAGTISALIFLLFAVPAVNTPIGSDLCRGGVGNWVPLGMTAPAIQRLAIVIIVAIPVGIARNALLSHGIGYIAEHSVEGMSMVVGLLILFRMTGILFFRIVMDSTMATWLAILGVCGPMLFSLVQLYRFPPMPPLADGEPRIPSDGRGLCNSLVRVLSNGFVMVQICAMTFLAAAFWGFGYHEMDIVKTKYYSLSSSGFLSDLPDILRLYLVFFAVLIFGARYVAPVMPIFRRAAAAKLALVLTAISIVVYTAMAVLNCDPGQIAGLSNDKYTQPGCSLQCGYTPALNEFSPVCMVDQMTSYLSPCHAGCSSNVTVGGVTVLDNCSCGAGRAVPGICSASQCRNIHELHKLLFIIISTSTTVAMQMHADLFVRASDPRDRGVVVGVACTFVSVIVFILGHGIFLAIRATTCVWDENGVCNLQNSSFPYIVGGTSAGFTLISFFISLFTWLSIRRRKDPIHKPDEYEM